MKTVIYSRYFGVYQRFIWHMWSHSESYQSKTGALRSNSRLLFWKASSFCILSPKSMQSNKCKSCVPGCWPTPPKIQNHCQKQFSSICLMHCTMYPLPIIPSIQERWYKCLITAIKMKHYVIKTRTVLNKPSENSPHRKQERGHCLSFTKLCSKSEKQGSRGVQCEVFASALRGSFSKSWEIKLIKKWCFEAKESI